MMILNLGAGHKKGEVVKMGGAIVGQPLFGAVMSGSLGGGQGQSQYYPQYSPGYIAPGGGGPGMGGQTINPGQFAPAGQQGPNPYAWDNPNFAGGYESPGMGGPGGGGQTITPGQFAPAGQQTPNPWAWDNPYGYGVQAPVGGGQRPNFVNNAINGAPQYRPVDLASLYKRLQGILNPGTSQQNQTQAPAQNQGQGSGTPGFGAPQTGGVPQTQNMVTIIGQTYDWNSLPPRLQQMYPSNNGSQVYNPFNPSSGYPLAWMASGGQSQGGRYGPRTNMGGSGYFSTGSPGPSRGDLRGGRVF